VLGPEEIISPLSAIGTWWMLSVKKLVTPTTIGTFLTSSNPNRKSGGCPCGNQLTFHQYQNLLPLKTSTQISVPFPSRPLWAKFWSRFLTAGFSNQLQYRSTLLSLAHFEAQAQAWRSSTSSISALYEACDDLGPSLRICLLDFSKAFDRIDRNVLLRKVQQMAVHPVLINWITDFLSIRLQWTKTDQDYSASKYIQADVPQGTNLGPLLFFNHGKWSQTGLETLSNSSMMIPQREKFCRETPNLISAQPWKPARNGYVIITWVERFKDERDVHPLIHQLSNCGQQSNSQHH
jgi:hypothetical protein